MPTKIEATESLPERIVWGSENGNPGVQTFLAEHREEYFFCERERCIMRKTACLQYQKEAKKKLHCKYGSYLLRHTPMEACERANCWDCEQGRQIRKEVINGEA